MRIDLLSPGLNERLDSLANKAFSSQIHSATLQIGHNVPFEL